MPRVEKTVFISYRRTNVPWALAIYQELTHHGYDVFFDYQSIDSGNFEKVILENIKSRAHFLVILTPSALERCKESGDWLRREIETAIDEKRNIVPLMLESFDFGSPLVTQALTGKLATLKKYNGLRVYSEYFFEAMDKLRGRYLNNDLSDIVLPTLMTEAKEITETEKAVANEAPKVEKEELTAQEWFERGYIYVESKNYNEAFRCFSEAIHLQSDFAEAYNNLGNVLCEIEKYQEAEAAYRKSIELNSFNATAYSNLGTLLSDENLKRYEEAEAAYRKSIELNPSNAIVFYNLGLLLHENPKRYQEAEVAYRKAIELDPSLRILYDILGLQNADSQPLKLMDLPVYGRISAGTPDWVSPSPNEFIRIKSILPNYHVHSLKGESITTITKNRKYFLLRVKGDSMNMAAPVHIENGDLVLMVKQDVAETGDIVASEIIREDEVATLKRYRVKNGKHYLEPESNNPIFSQHVALTKDFYIRGVAIAVLKPF